MCWWINSILEQVPVEPIQMIIDFLVHCTQWLTIERCRALLITAILSHVLNPNSNSKVYLVQPGSADPSNQLSVVPSRDHH